MPAKVLHLPNPVEFPAGIPIQSIGVLEYTGAGLAVLRDRLADLEAQAVRATALPEQVEALNSAIATVRHTIAQGEAAMAQPIVWFSGPNGHSHGPMAEVLEDVIRQDADCTAEFGSPEGNQADWQRAERFREVIELLLEQTGVDLPDGMSDDELVFQATCQMVPGPDVLRLNGGVDYFTDDKSLVTCKAKFDNPAPLQRGHGGTLALPLVETDSPTYRYVPSVTLPWPESCGFETEDTRRRRLEQQASRDQD